MRFRPANISLINRRHYLPRLLLTLSSFEKNDQRTLTGHYISVSGLTVISQEMCALLSSARGRASTQVVAVRWRLAGQHNLPVCSCYWKDHWAALFNRCRWFTWFVYLLQPWWASQRLGKFDPQLSLIPVSLASGTEAPLSNSSNLSNLDSSSGCPIKGPPGNSSIKQCSWNSHSGRLEFPRSLSDEDSVIFEPVHSDNDAKNLLGPELLQSKYKLLQAAMLATPERVKWWRFRSSQNKRERCCSL